MGVDFSGRVALVTGAGSGLGRAHALLLAGRGAKVVVNDIGGALDGSGGSHSAADCVVDEIKAAGGEAIANYANAVNPFDALNAVENAIGRFGRIDILVNNAGILRDKTFAKMDVSDFRAVMDVHVMGAVHFTQAVWPHMRAQNYGRIVMTTSGAGLYGNFGQSNYAAAKAALIGLMNVLKLEGERNNILVNAIAPIAGTRMTEGGMTPEAFARFKPEYVSAAVGYLCSEACTVTGHIVSAGAGYVARAQMMEAEGVHLSAEDAADPDAVAAAFDKIVDLSGAQPFASAPPYVEKALNGGAAS